VAVYQYEADEELYTVPGAFEAKAEEVMERAADSGADLLILPEYLNVPLAFSAVKDVVKQAESVGEGLELLSRRRGMPVELRELFIRYSDSVLRTMNRTWGRGAEEYGMAVLAGTYFALDDGKLVNRAVLYGADGEVSYVQDKIRLTPFEEHLVGLDAGSAEEAELFELSGFRIGISICRDTFFDDLEELMEQADIWIDLKANGEEYTDETALLFAEALRAREEEYRFPWGITVCLNGSFLDLLWEGSSEITRFSDRRNRVETVDRAESADGEELLVVTFVR
jgi:predicted amidohydrolase